jgi:Protein of unknown function (DUF3551)
MRAPARVKSMRYGLTAAVFIAAMAFGQAPARAHGNAPWCAVVAVGTGDVVWECQYQTIEACVPNVLAGNRGFCNHNPAYTGGASPGAGQPKRHRKRRINPH